MRTRSILGYAGAGLTIVAAALIPFLLIGLFTRGVAATGVHVDEFYSGGAVVRTIDRGAYKIEVHQLVRPRAWQRGVPYMELAWTLASALPSRISDEVDIDDDGRPDLRATFTVPQDKRAHLQVDVEPLRPGIEAMHGVGRESFSRLIARVKDRIIVRVQVNEK
jgi:hypothetical protein